MLSHRTSEILELCRPFVREGGAVLDFGCGTGKIAAAIRDAIGVPITGVDVVDYNETDVPVLIYDGRKLPFRNKSFGTSLAIFALHHCTNPESALAELVRVTRHRVLVIEDTWNHDLQKLWLYLIEVVTNRTHTWRVPLPFNFREPGAWQKLFQQLGLRIVAKETFRSYIPFLEHMLFVLDIKAKRSSSPSARSPR